ncbi:hypothetical protein [Deinococcus multiflagellatus]|uniref:Uncharacterized protein n=1 Tax=Deinococcus multiflagellatus TaxID=1656887 RepID=A0ABW1ZQ83_9DEIO
MPEEASELVYDPSQLEVLKPQIESLGHQLPDDPASPEFKELIDKLRPGHPHLAVAVQGMVRNTALDESNQIMQEAERNARRANAPIEKLREIFFVPNANGEAVFNKKAAAVAAVTGGLLLFAAIATYNPGGGAAATKPATASQGVTVTNGDGSTTTTYPDGSILIKKTDGSQEVKKPNGEVVVKTADGTITTTYPDGHTMVKTADGSSVETLSDGSKVNRDAAGNIISTTPPASVTGAENALLTGGPDGTTTTEAAELPVPPTGGAPAPTAQTDSYNPSEVGYTPAPAPYPTDAELASGVSTESPPAASDDPFSGTPYEAGIYNPTDAEVAAGYTAGKAPVSVPAPVTERVPVTFTPPASMAEQESALSTPVNQAEQSSVAAVTTSAPSPASVRLMVYRMGQNQQGGAQGSGEDNSGANAQPATSSSASSGGNAGATVVYRKASAAPLQVIRAGGAVSTPNTPEAVKNGPSTAGTATSETGGMTVFKKATPSTSLTRIVRPTSTSVENAPAESAPAPTPLAPTTDTGAPPQPTTLLAYAANNKVEGEAPATASPYRLGQRVLATLETGVYVAQGGGTLPIYASTQDGTLWRGTVSLDRTKRVLIVFDRAVLRDGTEVEVQASAYNLDGTPGLVAQYRDIAPTLANDLIRSAVSGVRDYVDAKLQATSTTTSTGGAVTVERQVPTIWESVAGSATGIFQLPTTQNTFVTVAQIKVGMQFALVYGPVKTEQDAGR